MIFKTLSWFQVFETAIGQLSEAIFKPH